MKIVRTDNYARETVSERLVAENIKHKSEAEVMLKALQDNPKRDDESWFKIAPDDYELYKFEP